jgi:MarR family transcriptional regulator, transcriptional regulator for hemolysin
MRPAKAVADSKRPYYMRTMKMNLAYQLVDKSRLVRKRFDESVRDHELTGPQARLLLLLERQPGGRQAFYAEELEVEPITLCRMVDRLEESGWLIRVPDPEDRRARLLQPTEKSREITDALRETIDAMLVDLLSALTQAEEAELARLLDKIGVSADAAVALEAAHG